VIDLRDTEFVDSTTLGVLLRARENAERSTIGFTVVLPQRRYTQVHQLLELTGLGPTFAIFDTLDEALSATRSRKNSSVRSAA
jgi:anti-anti-sigma factor